MAFCAYKSGWKLLPLASPVTVEQRSYHVLFVATVHNPARWLSDHARLLFKCWRGARGARGELHLHICMQRIAVQDTLTGRGLPCIYRVPHKVAVECMFLVWKCTASRLDELLFCRPWLCPVAIWGTVAFLWSNQSAHSDLWPLIATI